MLARRFALTFLASLLLASWLPVADALASGGPIEVSLNRQRAAIGLGSSLNFSSTVRNGGDSTSPPLIAHLNVVALEPGVYVDPEDWSSSRTRQIGPIPPGQSVTAEWDVKAVTTGRLAVYVSALPVSAKAGTATPPAVSGPIRLLVPERRDLSPGGALPLSIAIPLLVGVAMLTVRIRRG
jgi:hypothetical protein